MAIGKLNCVDELFIFPSCGDETGAIGAAWWTYIEHAHKNPEPLQHLYLGAKYGQDEIASILKKSQNLHGFTLEYLEDTPKSLAELIASGEIVAYFGGRMEFGARALGNRSIFADPRKPELIHTINEFIKGRDFWMPFAPAIIDSCASKYLINPKSFTAPYMIMAFDTTESRTEIPAAIHPWDYTVRPQMVTLDQSPFLYQVVREFEKLTGCGAILNTSFNIHGEPIVMSPQDAIDVFVRSGLKHLIIETNWLRKT
jgi:carbamoyltransferase